MFYKLDLFFRRKKEGLDQVKAGVKTPASPGLDGSRHGSGMHIGVYAFTNTDVDKLMFTLQDKFNIKCSIHYNRDKKPRIYIFNW